MITAFIRQKKLPGRWFEWVFFFILLTIIALIYFKTLIPDQGWGGDFAQYIHQAINIVEGVDMADTGYIYSRYAPSLGPRAYPPGFPLLLAPVYAIFGFDMGAFQALIILMQLAALVVIYLIYRRDVAHPTALILLLMMGLSPYLISFKRAIMSDVPFMLLSMAFVLWVERVYQKERFDFWAVFVAGLLAFAGYLIRTIGFGFLGALLVSDLIKRRRRPTSFTLWIIIWAVVLAAVSRFLLGGGEESYLDQLADYVLLTPIYNIEHYLLNSIRGFWAGPSLSWGAFTFPILWLIAVPLIFYGFIKRAQHSSLFMELFFLFQLGIVLIWPSVQELRFLYPVLPLFLLYAGIGFEGVMVQVGRRSGFQVARILAVGVAIAIISIYVIRTRKVVAAEGPITDGPYALEAATLFQFIREKTDPEAVFVFYKPRVLSLYAGRQASAFPYEQPMPIAAAYLDEISADYALLKNSAEDSNLALATFINACPNAFELTFANQRFKTYQIRYSALEVCWE